MQKTRTALPLVLALTAPYAQADLIEVSVNGIMSYYGDFRTPPMFPGVSDGDAFNATFVYDTASAPIDSAPSTATYDLVNMSFSFGGYTFGSNPADDVTSLSVDNDKTSQSGTTISDAISVALNTRTITTDQTHGDFSSLYFFVNWYTDSSATNGAASPLTSTSLDNLIFTPSAWQNTQMTFEFDVEADGYITDVSVRNLTGVPLPATAWLLASGLILLGRFSRTTSRTDLHIKI